MKRNILPVSRQLLAPTMVAMLVLLAACSPPTTTTLATTPTITITVTPTQQGRTPAPDLPDMVAVVAKVKPSVVAINDQVTTTSRRGGSTTQAAAGSGWILDSNGLIVTNDHVVSGATNIVVTLDDGRIFPAVKVITDPVNDLAIVKVNGSNLPAATVGDSSKLQLGMPVVAIGNALGEGTRVTGGLVSNLGTSITLSQTQTLYDLIETDAAINPGNSGGPLVNMAGEVIGIVNAKVSAAGIEGMGYAISSNTAIPILQQLATKGYVVRPWIGVVFQTVDPGVAFVYGLSVQKGVMLVSVTPSSPASAAGLQADDVVATINGEDITTASQAADAITSSQIGQKLEIVYWRGNAKSTAQVIPVQNPTP